MDGYEATRIVFSRIQNLDPDNASRIMGLLLIQDHGDKEMIRLAFGPESLVHSVIFRSRRELGLSNNSPPLTPSTPLSPSPFFSRRLSIPPPLTIPNQEDDMLLGMDELHLQDQLSFLNEEREGWGQHRRSCSDDPAGFGWKPCLYFARGYCKNGTACRFLHGDMMMMMMMEQHDERSKSAAQQQRVMAAYSPKGINLVGMVSPASRQIYLTFPADSTFREEDVSNYFSIYGPVQDVRIPYQQKRMFGFVTFVYPDTVKLILAKGNPHFVCDARVLVKPYKEKAKLLDHKKQTERGDFSSSPCGTPTGLDSPRDLYDLPSPGGMLYSNAQEVLWRRKLEEQALEIQSRRLMNLQLLDVKKHHHHRAFSTGSPSPATLFSPRHLDQQLNGIGKEGPPIPVDEDRNVQQESSEHNLPDSPFASPTKAENDATTNTNSSSSSSLDMASFKSFNCQIPRFSSGHSHGVIGMFAGTGGSTFPVGI